jgi:DNA-binding transcriptional LysR family regulator
MVVKTETFSGSLDDVRAFCAVVDFGSISAAARELAETKGSVSRRITRLENTLGTKLLARTSRAVSALNEGLEFYEKAAAAITLLDDAREDVRKSRDVLRGAIRVTAPLDIATEILPDLIVEFRKQQPLITVEILATDAKLDLTANRIDIALRVIPGEVPDSEYQAVLVTELDFGVFAAPSYLVGKPSVAVPQDLTIHDLILPRDRPGMSHMTLTCTTRVEKVALRPVLRASDFACILRLVVSGAGVAPLPAPIASRWVDDGALVRLLPDWHIYRLKLYAISAPGRQMSARVRELRDFIRQNFP